MYVIIANMLNSRRAMLPRKQMLEERKKREMIVFNSIHPWLQSASHQCIPSPFQLQPMIKKMAKEAFSLHP
jgi:hypothetical protein